MEEGSTMEMEMVQIKGVDSTDRTTIAELKGDAKLIVRERLMTHGKQYAASAYTVDLDGDGSSADISLRCPHLKQTISTQLSFTRLLSARSQANSS